MDVQTVADIYSRLDKQNLTLLHHIYHPQVVFQDPLHQVHGLSALEDYFLQLYSNVQRCDFEFDTLAQSGDEGFLTWTMLLQHPRLNSGNALKVHGASHLRFRDALVIYHRDYFDLGEMLYERLPILGSVIRWLKGRMA